MNYFVTGLCWLEKQAGIWLNISKKNMKLLQEYKMEDVIRIARLNSKGRLNTGAVGDIRKNVTEARR